MKTIDLIKSDLIAIGAKTDIFHLLLYFLFSYNKSRYFLSELQIAIEEFPKFAYDI